MRIRNENIFLAKKNCLSSSSSSVASMSFPVEQVLQAVKNADDEVCKISNLLREMRGNANINTLLQMIHKCNDLHRGLGEIHKLAKDQQTVQDDDDQIYDYDADDDIDIDGNGNGNAGIKTE